MVKKRAQKKLLKFLEQWQTGVVYTKKINGKKCPYYVHLLTCGMCNHIPLKPKLAKGEVVLVCPCCKIVRLVPEWIKTWL